jgi:hypothetical protein
MMLLLNLWELGIAALAFHSEFAELFPCSPHPWTAILRFTVKKQIPINKVRRNAKACPEGSEWDMWGGLDSPKQGSCRKE